MPQSVLGRGANYFSDIIIQSEVLFDDFEITQNEQGTGDRTDDTFEINTNGTNIFSLDQSGNLTIAGSISLDTGDAGKNKVAKDIAGLGLIQLEPPDEITTNVFLTGHTRTEVEAGIGTLTDETALLESLLQNTASELVNMGFDADAPTTITIQSEKGYIHLNGKLGVPDKVSLDFKTPIVIGNDFSLRLSGTSTKEPSTSAAAPYVDAVFASGLLTITINDNAHDVSTWVSGDLVNIRDESEDASIDRIIDTIALVSGDQYTITLTEAINFTTAGDNTDKVRRFVQQTPDTAVTRGDSLLTFTSTTGFAAGDFIQILDNRKAGDYTGNPTVTPSDATSPFWYSDNNVRWESAKIVRIATSTDMYLDRPLSHDYDDLTTCYVIKISPRQHQFIANLLAIQIEAPDQSVGVNVRNNTHIIQLEACLDCQVRNCSFTDEYDNLSMTLFPTIENFIRVRESYNCQVINCNIDRSNRNFTSSGGSYGITMYYTTACSIQGGMLSTLRHNILLQGATSCRIDNVHIVNPLISGIDLHGLGSRDCVISNCLIDVAGIPSLDDTNTSANNTSIGALRVGNSFHPFGDDYNVFQSITIRIGNVADTNLTNIYGIELEAPSSYNLFKDCKVISTSQSGVGESVYGVHIADYDRERILVTMTNNQFVDCYFENCEDASVWLDGQSSFQSSTYSYHTGTMTANENDSTHIILPATIVNIADKDASDYTNYYGGSNITFQFGTVSRNWDITFTSGGENGNTYEITAYNATTRVATLGGALAVGTITGLTFELEDDATVVSSLPIINTTFMNCKFIKNNKLCFSQYTSNTTFIGNTFDTNCVKDTSDKYTFTLDGDTNMNIIDNTTYNVYRWTSINNLTTPKLMGNKHCNPQENLTWTTAGTNTNIEYANNDFVGYTPSYSISGTDSYVASKEYLGYDATPDVISMIINNDNGRVGIGTATPTTFLNIHTGAGSGGFDITNDTATTGARFNYSTGALFDTDNADGGIISWSQSGTEVMRINTAGKLGIGIAPDDTLHVHQVGSGGLQLSNDTDTDGFTLNLSTGGTIRMDTVGGGKYEWKQAGVTQMEMDTDGNLGIGISPGDETLGLDPGFLTLYNTVNGWNNGTIIETRADGGTRITNAESEYIDFYVGAVQAMRIEFDDGGDGVGGGNDTAILRFYEAILNAEQTIVEDIYGSVQDFFDSNVGDTFNPKQWFP
jgi:hypothetical protein